MRHFVFSLLAVMATAVWVEHGSNCQSMATSDTVILIKPEEMRIIPKTVFEKKLGLETISTTGHEEETTKMEEEPRREEEETRRKEEEKKIEEKKNEEGIFKAYVAVGVVKLLFDNVTEPFTLFYDGETQRSRVDLGEKGLVRCLQLANLNRMYRIEFPSLEQLTHRSVCIEMRGSHDKPIKVLEAIPNNFNKKNFQQIGEDRIGHVKVNRWKFERKDDKGMYLYTFFMFTEPETNKPVRLEVITRSLKSNKAIDHYQIDYKYFFPTRPSDDVFLKPIEIECRSITGLSQFEEEHREEKDEVEKRPLPRLVVEHERLRINPLASLINPDQYVEHERTIDKLFDNFRRRYQKKYESDDEFEMRRAAFCHNFRYINYVNRAGLPYRLRLNHLADLTNDELRKMLGIRGIGKLSTENHGVAFDQNVHNIVAIDRLPNSIDWRLFGAVTPVVHQTNHCASDWAIAATHVIESALYLRTNRLVKLAPQELIDCGHETGNHDCESGTPWQAFEFAIKTGISSENEYGPYSFHKKECKRDAPISAKIKRWVLVGNNEHELKKAIAMNGPVAALLDAAHKSFFFYANGIYKEPNCRWKANEVNHAVTVVGYGTLEGRDYFLLKNSFSNDWGLNGYMLINANGNQCGLLSAPTFVDM